MLAGMPRSRFRGSAGLWPALLLACTKPSPPAVEPPAAALTSAGPAGPDTTAAPAAAACSTSTFTPTEGGVVWSSGAHRVRFRAIEEAGELAYNYRRRTVRMEAVDGESAYLESSCYTETDCDAPNDADGNERWCLVAHGLRGAPTLFELVARHRPCESAMELLEALAVHSASPTCFRVALGSYPGIVYDELGYLSETMATQGVPAEVITAVEAHAKAANDADGGRQDPQDEAASAAALRELRQVLAPYTTTEAAWQVDLLAARALASLEDRHPYTLVGPDETFYDVVSTTEDPWTTVPTAPPWVK